jgi:hypothetical protein
MEDFDLDEALASGGEEPKKETKSNYNNNNSKGPRLYEDKNIVAKDPSKLKFKTSNYKTFTYYDNGKVTDEKLNLLKKVATTLFNQGYTYNSSDDTRSKGDEAIRSLPNAKVKLYKLWAKAKGAEQAFQIASETPNRISYEVACGIKKNFLELSDFIRCISARTVQTLLGKDCDEPVSLLLSYTEDGATSFSKGFKIQNAGNLVFPMQIANKCNISICNIGSDKFVDDLKTFLTSTGGNTSGVETSKPETKEEPQPEVKEDVTETQADKSTDTLNVSDDLEDIW